MAKNPELTRDGSREANSPSAEDDKDAAAERKTEEQDRIGRRGILYLTVVLFVGLIALAVYASKCGGLQVVGVGFVVAGAALLIGGVLGFLFGIPRTVAPDPKLSGSAGTSYLPSTDLEQIADWLTKILVGVGLTQLSSIPSKMIRLGQYLKPELGGNETFAMGLSVYFVLCGFLIGFLWTRLYLPRALKWSDAAAEALAGVTEALAKRVDERRADDAAQTLVSRQLNLETGLPPASPEELTDKIEKATISCRGKIFYQAATFRSNHWQDGTLLKRTIPIFEALIASDSEGLYPENHGQLGCALKDIGNIPEAVRELDKAIEMHEKLKKGEEPAWYKFQRSVCRILSDDDYKRQKASNDDTKKRILDDLRAGSKGGSVVTDAMGKEAPLLDWLKLNNLVLRGTAIVANP